MQDSVLSVEITSASDYFVLNSVVSFYVCIVNNTAKNLKNITLKINNGKYLCGGVTFFPLSYMPFSSKININGESEKPTVKSENGELIFKFSSLKGGSVTLISFKSLVSPLVKDKLIKNTAEVIYENMHFQNSLCLESFEAVKLH